MHRVDPAAVDRETRAGAVGGVARDTRAWFTRRAGLAAREQLWPLLERARELDLDDADAVARLGEQAHRVSARLAAAGQLPPALVIDPQAPGVVIVRAISVAWRRVTPPPTNVTFGP